MNNYFKIWIEGWKVIWRITVFRLTLILLASPLILLYIFVTKQLERDGNILGTVGEGVSR